MLAKNDSFFSATMNDMTTEYELLKYLTINQGIVLSRDNLMEKIWSSDYEGESRTLDVHIKTLRQKLGKAGSYIKTVRNVGYFLDLDTDV